MNSSLTASVSSWERGEETGICCSFYEPCIWESSKLSYDYNSHHIGATSITDSVIVHPTIPDQLETIIERKGINVDQNGKDHF